MKKFTLFALMLVGVVTGFAQSAIVGTYNGDINLTHLTGQEASLEAQAVTISETEDGKFNVTFPSFAIMTGTELGEFTVEDVAVSAEADGSYTLAKEVFAITPPPAANGMTSSYPNCTFSGTIYADGAAEMIVEVKQNPAMALTTAYFYAEAGSNELPYLGEHKGNLKLTHVDGSEVDAGEKTATVSEVDGKVNVLFPSFALVMGMETGDITIEDVTVTDNGDGSYSLAKETFNITAGIMSFPNSSFSGTVSTDGAVEMKVAVQQQPGMALTTATLTNGSSDEEPGGDPTVFEWGTATWNTEDGVVYDGIAEFNAAGLALTYPNPTGFNLTFLHIIAVEFDIFVDGNETPVKSVSTAQGSNIVTVEHPFVEGHAYKLVSTRSLLAQANLATYTTDTLSVNTDSYSISFTIKGPELQKTIDVEAYMSLAITDQEYNKTVSKVDVADICATLGINNISEAVMHPLSPNDSYCDHMETFDWWRDADGEFTLYNGGWNPIFGHNAYPAVYCIKTNAAADSVTYYFYDYWTEYVPEEEGEVEGGTVTTRAPETSRNSVIWDWTNEDGSVTQYKRNYRVDEGKDYQSRVMYVANGKSVIVRATLHFVSIEEYEKLTSIEQATANSTEAVAYYTISGVRQATLQPGINIVRYADGTARKVYVK